MEPSTLQTPQEAHSEAESALAALLAVTSKTDGVQRSILDRYFWLFVAVGLIGVPIVTIGLAWAVAAMTGPRAGVPADSILNVSPIVANGPTSLCPTEPLDFQFSMSVLEQGVFDIDQSTWRLVPPETVLFSESQRFVAAEPITYIVERRWVIPAEYIDPATNRAAEWQPGQYERQIFVTAVGRDAEPSIQVLPFSIRDDCG